MALPLTLLQLPLLLPSYARLQPANGTTAEAVLLLLLLPAPLPLPRVLRIELDVDIFRLLRICCASKQPAVDALLRALIRLPDFDSRNWNASVPEANANCCCCRCCELFATHAGQNTEAGVLPPLVLPLPLPLRLALALPLPTRPQTALRPLDIELEPRP